MATPKRRNVVMSQIPVVSMTTHLRRLVPLKLKFRIFDFFKYVICLLIQIAKSKI